MFNTDAREGRRLRVWDRVRDDFVERIVVGERAPSVVLAGLTFVVATDPKLGAVLRLADSRGQLVPTEVEALTAERDALQRDRARLLTTRTGRKTRRKGR